SSVFTAPTRRALPRKAAAGWVSPFQKPSSKRTAARLRLPVTRERGRRSSCGCRRERKAGPLTAADVWHCANLGPLMSSARSWTPTYRKKLKPNNNMLNRRAAIIISLGLFLSLLPLPCTHAAVSDAKNEIPFKKFVLTNGLTLIV